MEVANIISLLLLQILVEGDTLSDQVVKPKIKDDLNKFAGQSFTFDDLLDAGSCHADLIFELFELLLQQFYSIAVLPVVQDVVLVIFEDIEQKRKDFVLLLLNTPVPIRQSTPQ
jgi:hypothetical protein